MNPSLYFRDGPLAGATNMAIDELLLDSACESGTPASLRFYQWREPTLSLGYFQRLVDRKYHPASRDCAVVRRSTGGGAILHDRELTYSFTAWMGDGRKANMGGFYDDFHETLIETLREFGVQAEKCDDPRADSPFLCFQRRTLGDVLVDGAKIGGSAQRRRRSGLLQHGSVLLHRSPAAPELPGIAELTGVEISADRLADQWADRLADRLGIRLERSVLSASQRDLAAMIERRRFLNDSWTARR